MIESTAFRGADVTRSPTGTMSTRQLGAKRSITKRFTGEPHREVRIAIMARPHRVKAYRAVYSFLVARGLSPCGTKGTGCGRSWLKTDGCVRVFQSCDRRTPPALRSLYAPQGPLEAVPTPPGRQCAIARWQGVTRRAERVGGAFGRPAGTGARVAARGWREHVRASTSWMYDATGIAIPGRSPACSLHRRMRCARAGQWRSGAVPLGVGGWEDVSRTQLHRSQVHLQTAPSSRGLSSPRHRWPVTKSLNPQTASR